MIARLFTIALVTALVTGALGGCPVEESNTQEFLAAGEKGGLAEDTVVTFYSPTCSHCQRFEPVSYFP